MLTLDVRSRLLVSGCMLILVTLLGCSNMTNRTSTISPERSSTPVADRNTQPMRACDSIDFALSESELATAHRISGEDEIRRSSERYANPSSQLSLYLEPIQDTIAYANPVVFRLTITNDSERSIIFCRPQGITIENQPPLAGLIVNLRSVSNEWQPPREWMHWGVHAPTPEEFSRLLPGESCMMDFQLMWEEGTIRSPLPPGDYQMDVLLRSRWGAPLADRQEMTFYDAEAWVGKTEASNVITLTISPSEE